MCTKSFKRPQDLKKHEKIHTEEHHAQHKHSKAITVPGRQSSQHPPPSQQQQQQHALDHLRPPEASRSHSLGLSHTHRHFGIPTPSPEIPHPDVRLQRPEYFLPNHSGRPDFSAKGVAEYPANSGNGGYQPSGPGSAGGWNHHPHDPSGQGSSGHPTGIKREREYEREHDSQTGGAGGGGVVEFLADMKRRKLDPRYDAGELATRLNFIRTPLRSSQRIGCRS